MEKEKYMYNFQTASFILIGSFLALLILRVPITFTLFASSIATAVYLKIPLMSIVQRMVSGVNSFFGCRESPKRQLTKVHN